MSRRPGMRRSSDRWLFRLSILSCWLALATGALAAVLGYRALSAMSMMDDAMIQAFQIGKIMGKRGAFGMPLPMPAPDQEVQ